MKALKNIISEYKSLRWLLFLTNWLYQGIPQADTSKKIYKLVWLLILSVLSYMVIGSLTTNHFELHVVLSIISGHTLNWLLNSNKMVILIHRAKYLKTSPSKLFNYLYGIRDLLTKKDWIVAAISSGGISRGTMNPHSDLDVNIIRKKGFQNALAALFFSTRERIRADLNGVPLDIIISDKIDHLLKKTDGNERYIILVDPVNFVQSFNIESINLEDAEKLNKINDKPTL
ncbi:MAG: hypothetical protein KC414_07360 [Romboutsia sp.]|nr:hypothetical protein [Romboutsia sp.]